MKARAKHLKILPCHIFRAYLNLWTKTGTYICIAIASLKWSVSWPVFSLATGNSKSKDWVLFTCILIPSAKDSAWELLRTSVFVNRKCHDFQNLYSCLSHNPQLYPPDSIPPPSQSHFSFRSSSSISQRSLIPQLFLWKQVCNPFQGREEFLPFHPPLILTVGLIYKILKLT